MYTQGHTEKSFWLSRREVIKLFSSDTPPEQFRPEARISSTDRSGDYKKKKDQRKWRDALRTDLMAF